MKTNDLLAIAEPAGAFPLPDLASMASQPPAVEERGKSFRRGRPRTKIQPLRISRGGQVIGKWTSIEVRERLASEDLVSTDSFYDEEVSEWLPLTELPARETLVPTTKSPGWPCYCGTGLPFRVCCGEGDHY